MFDVITNAVNQTGYVGIFLLMVVENVFPPIPSELIMPLAGYVAASGQLNFGLAVFAGSAGSLLGALLWYWLGLWLGLKRLKTWAARHGRWMALTPEDLDAAAGWFHRHGGATVFVGRLIPGVRTLISVPAGVCGMGFWRFLLYSALGTAAWTVFLTGSGYLLEEQFRRVETWLNPVSNIAVGLIVAGYLYRVVTFGKRQRG